jgi:hypothetical protein
MRLKRSLCVAVLSACSVLSFGCSSTLNPATQPAAITTDTLSAYVTSHLSEIQTGSTLATEAVMLGAIKPADQASFGLYAYQFATQVNGYLTTGTLDLSDVRTLAQNTIDQSSTPYKAQFSTLVVAVADLIQGKVAGLSGLSVTDQQQAARKFAIAATQGIIDATQQYKPVTTP